MRIRRKKHLDDRLKAVADYLYISDLDDRNFQTAVLTHDYLDLENWFGRKAPLYLEIGCGKGGFAAEFAKQNPQVNVLGIEKSANVIVQACEKAQREQISNLRFFKGGAEYLTRYLPENSVERIFLNFSCPFPKKSYASHRLTHPKFLRLYSRVMTDTAEIHQKTDNRQLFEFSIETLSGAGFALKNISLDLHRSDFEGNIETEYEKKFVAQGLPIYRLEAYRKKGEDHDQTHPL